MLTPRQKRERQKKICGTDVARILGLSPFGTARDVYWEKTTPLPETEEKATPAQRAGNLHEGAAIRWAKEELGIKRTKSNQWRTNGIFGATLDAVILDPGRENEHLEAKTTGMVSFVRPEVLAQWGESGSDAIPAHVLCQVALQMHCAGTVRCHIPLLIGGREPRIYHVERSEDLIGEIVSLCEAWKRQYWDAGIPPPGGEVPPEYILRRVVREAEKRVEVEVGLAVAYRKACEAVKEAEKAKKAALEALVYAMGDAQIAELPGDEEEFTYIATVAERLDQKALKAEHPDVYSQYLVKKANDSPTPRFRKARKAE